MKVIFKCICAISCLAVLVLPEISQAMDAEAAKILAKHNNCLLCHGTDREKVGPAFHQIAAKYKGNAQAEAKLINHLTSGEPAKFPDGHTQPHMIINTTDKAELKNLVDWILSL